MVRDILIELYLLLFRVLFNIMKLFPLQNKVCFVVSFGDNSLYVYEEMRQQNRHEQVVFLKKSACSLKAEQTEDATIINFETMNLIDMFRSIYHLATSQYIMIDNYYGFLATANFKEVVQVIQLWHASGAVKKFGLGDLSVLNRSNVAKKRFISVYRKFNKIVVGSEEMAKIFTEAFNLDSGVILRSGVPRTDIFYDKVKREQIINRLYHQNPLLRDKQVILYAPTYRDDSIDEFKLQLDLEKLQTELGENSVLILKLHPVIKQSAKQYEQLYKGFVFDFSTYQNVNELLLITDLLITDYSSIHYEYSILKKPMLFFAYDLESYQSTRGIIGNYRHQVPGPIVTTTEELLQCIKMNQFDLGAINDFSERWNRYSKGYSSINLVNYLFIDSEKEKQRDVM